MQIKAQGLLNAAKWIEEEYGRDGLRDVLQACSPAVRDRYTEVTAINWHPVEEFLEFVDAAEKTFRGNQAQGKIADLIGAAGARANMKGTLVRLGIWITRPEALMKRCAGLWRQFNDEGLMSLVTVEEHVARLELTGVKRTYPLFCAVINGWCREVGVAVRAISPVSKHIECKGRGDARCIWEVRYARVDLPAPTGTPPRE